MSSVREKRQDLLKKSFWLLHHDNASACNNFSIREFLAKIKSLCWTNRHTHRIWLPSTFFFFPKLKNVIKGTHFEDVKAIKKAVTKELQMIPSVAEKDGKAHQS